MNPSSRVRLGEVLLGCLAVGFAVAFSLIVIPALVRDGGDLVGGLGQGFVNPYSAGYSLDVITCWAVLAVWILIERKERGIKHGWICLVLGLVPGVATGLAAYLLLRRRQLPTQP